MNRIDKHLAAIGLSAWSLLGVPVTFFLYIEWSYRYALSQGKLPFLTSSEWLWYVAFGICLASGVIGFIKLPFFRERNSFSVGVPYLILMGVALLGIHLVVACHNGDCL